MRHATRAAATAAALMMAVLALGCSPLTGTDFSDLSDRQQAMTVLETYRVAQTAALEAVESDSVPAEAKDRIREAEAAARAAVIAYAEAQRDGDGDTAALLGSAHRALGELLAVLAEHGAIETTQTGLEAVE